MSLITASIVLVPSLSVLLFNDGYIDFRIMVQMVQIASTTTQRGYMTKPFSDQINRLLPVLVVMSHVTMMRDGCSSGTEQRGE